MFWRTAQAKLCVESLFRDHYADYARLAHSSVRRYRCELRRWTRLMGTVRILDLQTEHFIKFRDRCLEIGLQPETIEGTIKVIKAILRYAKDRGWIVGLPVFGKPLKMPHPEPDPATAEEINTLWNVLKYAEFPARGRLSPCNWWECWLTLDWFTALRLEDSMRLAREHLRPMENAIRFQASKTSLVHWFPVCHPVNYRLDQLTATEQPLLLGRHSQHRLRAELERLCAAAGIRRLTPRSFRQSGVTAWKIAGRTAGDLIHGTGLPKVLESYVGVLEILREALPRLKWPEEMLDTGRQRRLF